MFCEHCGKESHGKAFCPFCGAQMQPSAADTPKKQMTEEPTPPASQPQAHVADDAAAQIQQPEPPTPAKERSPRSKSKRKLWIILGASVVAVAAIAVALFFVLTQPFGGQWYNEDRGEVITVNADGTLELASLAGSIEGDYSYQRLGGNGSCDIGDTSYDFTADSKRLIIDDLAVYTKAPNYFDLDDFFDEYGTLGTWYSEELGEVITFSAQGKLAHHSVIGVSNSQYDYSFNSQDGSLTLNFATYNFDINKAVLSIKDIGEFTKGPDDFDIEQFLDPYRVLGAWYNEEVGDVLVFDRAGKMTHHSISAAAESDYDYNGSDRKGVLTLGSESLNFQVQETHLNIDDLGVYTKADKDFDIDGFLDPYRILGAWYNEEVGEILIFDQENTLTTQYANGSSTTTYSFDPTQKNGTTVYGDLSYNFEYQVDQLTFADLGTYQRAGEDFDTEAFLDDYSDSVFGRWYQQDGNYMLYLHPNGNYDLVAYDEEISGTYLQNVSSLAVQFDCFDVQYRAEYMLNSDSLLEFFGDDKEILDTLVRDVAPLKGSDKLYEEILGTWSYYDLMLIEFQQIGTVYITFTEDNEQFQGSFVYSPLAHGGYLTMYGEEELFVCIDELILYREVILERIE